MKRVLVIVGVLAAFVAGIAVERVRSEAKPRMWADALLDLSTDEIPKRARVYVNLDHWEPGAETGRHVHPGPTVFVILEGELEEVPAGGRARALKAGQAFWKPARTDHNVRNVSGRGARALAVHLDPAR
ncbi:MAG: cupin domain-containing protein [Candidatus Rokubacteria bacterium]|nr:cupin domain-containing protein [Candidatus Rokubacteria bacterium]